MKSRYRIHTTVDFKRKYKKLTKGDKILKSSVRKTFKLLSKDPFYKGLKTHKVNTRMHGSRYSSKVNKDIRIIWDFTNERIFILVLTIGGHSGKHRVYK